jgi:hypothetical protein
MTQPPRNDYAQLVAQIIASRPEGVSFERLAIETSIFPDDLAKLTLQLKQAGIIELRGDARLYIRPRRKKQPPPRPTFLQRLRALFYP